MAYDGIARGIAGKALAKIKDIAVAGGFTVEIVPTLPTTDISSHKIYFMLNDNNTYDEYMYIDGAWEKIGSTSVSLDDYYTKEEVDTDINTVSQGIINVSASITAINEDITTVNDELDEIDGQINDINAELDTHDGIIENLIDGQMSLTADIEMYKQKVIRDGEATFLAVDNTDYQWTTNQTALVATLPTPTDLTRTHVINLNFIAGSSSPLSLFGDFNTPVNWEFVEGCLYQIEFKYIETAWEIKQYCPEKEYASADDLDDKIDIPATELSYKTVATIADLQDNTKYLYGNHITSLTITASSQTFTGGESTIYCGTGDSVTFSYPTDIKAIGSDELKPNKMYVISIASNIMVVGEVN